MNVIINYGMGNLRSIQNMIKRIGHHAIISSNIQDIVNAEKLILPGVGAFNHGMNNLNDLNMISVLNNRVLIDHVPILGICLGMQLMTNHSEEGDLPGLSWINALTVKFSFQDNKKLKIPHMGWNSINIKRNSLLFKDMVENPRFYFVHSYHVMCNDAKDVIATTQHGYSFPSVLQKNNIYGTQFHPEKSHKYGLLLLKNFMELV